MCSVYPVLYVAEAYTALISINDEGVGHSWPAGRLTYRVQIHGGGVGHAFVPAGRLTYIEPQTAHIHVSPGLSADSTWCQMV